LIDAGKYKPTYCNSWLAILFSILRAAVRDFNLPRDLTMGVGLFSTKGHKTYTSKNPNSLSPEQARIFVRTVRRKFPQRYAMTLLGFVTGLRPSSLRPLRRQGPDADIDWTTGVMQVRRSNSRRQAIRNRTKQGTDY
jgi:hypothetical protein